MISILTSFFDGYKVFLNWNFNSIPSPTGFTSLLYRKWINVTTGLEHVLIFGAANPGQAISEAPISDHRQSWGYEDGPWKEPEPRSVGGS